MLTSALPLLAAATPDSSTPPFVGFIVIAIAVWLSSVIGSRIIRRQSMKTVAAASGGVADAFAMPITPHAPLAAELAAVRALVGDASPEPRLTSFSRPVVTVDDRGITISEKKLGTLVTIPVADVASIDAGSSSIKPAIALVATRVPSVVVLARRGEGEASIAFTPLLGANKATPAQAQAYAAALTERVAALRV